MKLKDKRLIRSKHFTTRDGSKTVVEMTKITLIRSNTFERWEWRKVKLPAASSLLVPSSRRKKVRGTG